MRYTYDRNRYEYRQLQRPKLFTGNKDLDRNILLHIDDDKILFNTCKLNKYAESVCDDYFWGIKINELLPGLQFPAEYKNNGEELYYIIKNNKYFIYDKGRAVRYYDNIADWSIVTNHPDLLKSLLKINIFIHQMQS